MREPCRSPFWAGEFTSQPHRPLEVVEFGRALSFPNVLELTRRMGMPRTHARYWYRWRDLGLDVYTADRLATNASLHPIEVWGEAWEAA